MRLAELLVALCVAVAAVCLLWPTGEAVAASWSVTGGVIVVLALVLSVGVWLSADSWRRRPILTAVGGVLCAAAGLAVGSVFVAGGGVAMAVGSVLGVCLMAVVLVKYNRRLE